MSAITYIVASIGVCVIVFAGFCITIKQLMKPAIDVYATRDQREEIKGRVSGMQEEQSYGGRAIQSTTAYPIYKAKVDGKFVESVGFVRYKKEDLEMKIKTGEAVKLYYDKGERKLWNADEIPLRRRQMFKQTAAMMAAIVFAFVILPAILRH